MDPKTFWFSLSHVWMIAKYVCKNNTVICVYGYINSGIRTIDRWRGGWRTVSASVLGLNHHQMPGWF